MSEPSETSGRPQATPILQEHQPEGNSINPSSSARTKHRKSSRPSDEFSEGSKSTNPQRRPGTTIEASSGPHTGSSRSAQRSASSPTNMASHMSSVHYTRTGRISKAKKGLKVHNCEHCGRVSYMPSFPSSCAAADGGGLSTPLDRPSTGCTRSLLLSSATYHSHGDPTQITHRYADC
jgi:hypothetical protein